ncbi:HD domain-containing protein [Heliobacillus mobilis]|uniref:HD domain-containing protein n=1 Tax=Heliobacterium mobile TaxID=28064 RepID=A0A6I3SND7_HELMO|nr:HD domain-containing protein [Heliobacterium mobile]MTV50543.1 HD domain-containing protein [Heliobacterium mobile]
MNTVDFLKHVFSSDAPGAALIEAHQSGELAKVFPELDRLFGVKQPEQYHPEGCAGIHSALVLGKAAERTGEPRVLCAALLHDIGKGVTDPSLWPRHIGHESEGAKMIPALGEKYGLPQDWVAAARFAARYHMAAHTAKKAGKIAEIILGAAKNPIGVDGFATVVWADHNGRGRDNVPNAFADSAMDIYRTIVEASKHTHEPSKIALAVAKMING